MLDIGTGNGRNIQSCRRTLIVGLDLSFDLLENFIEVAAQKVAGSFPNLPFRKNSGEEILSVAVIHHLPSMELRKLAVAELFRVTAEGGELTATVWRKWRPSYRQKLFTAIRRGENTDPLVNHHRPWKTATGEVIAHRFYHYYTRRELYTQAVHAGYTSIHIEKMGGKSGEENFIVVAHK